MTVRFPRVVLATGNAHKVAEVRAIVQSVAPGIEVVGYDGPSPVEDGTTFVANALIKARAAAERTGLPAIADDSGIAVDALHGAPGIRSARFAGTGSDADNRDLLLARMAGVDDRKAQFVCAAVLVAEGDEIVSEAVWPGTIVREARGSGGFGYDPVFVPEGRACTAAELTPEEKNAVSHRGQAFRALASLISS